MAHDFTSIGGCMAALNSLYTEEPTWSDEFSEKFREFMSKPVPVEQIVETGEVLYGFRNELSPEAAEIAANVVAFATMNMWWGLAEGNRGGKMAQAILRDSGKPAPAGLSWPPESGDPAAKYAATPEAEEPEIDG